MRRAYNNNILFLGGWLFLIAILLSGTSYAGSELAFTIENPSENYSKTLSESDMLALPQVTITTENEFIDGMAEFSGPLARDVVAMLGQGDFDTVTLKAANDYSVEVPLDDFLQYDVIFAMFQNGERLSSRDKGPMWVIYPMSDHKELRDRIFNDRLIWQLIAISVK